MGWTFQEYEAQPGFFLEQIAVYLNQEAKRIKKEEKDIERQMNKTKGKGYSR